jgi:hypothetical protein
VQTDAEHQKNDADIGELLGKSRIGDETRRERPHDNARQQIAGDGRNP